MGFDDLTLSSGATLTANAGRTMPVKSFTLSSCSLDIPAGMVALGASGSFASASSLKLVGGATLDLAGRTQAFAGVDGTGGLIDLGAGALTVSASGSFGGVISGTGSVTKDGSGDLVLSGDLSIDKASVLSFADIGSQPVQFVQDTTVFARINDTGTWDGGTLTFNSQTLADDSCFFVVRQMGEIDYNSTSGRLNYTADYQPGDSFVTVTAVPGPSAEVMLASAAAVPRRARLAEEIRLAAGHPHLATWSWLAFRLTSYSVILLFYPPPMLPSRRRIAMRCRRPSGWPAGRRSSTGPGNV